MSRVIKIQMKKTKEVSEVVMLNPTRKWTVVQTMRQIILTTEKVSWMKMMTKKAGSTDR